MTVGPRHPERSEESPTVKGWKPYKSVIGSNKRFSIESIQKNLLKK